MAGYSKEKIAVFIFLLLIFAGCANQLPPGGGEVDLVPPKIMKVFPENGTTDFKKDYIEIDFSKYVERRTFQDALFISPAIEGELDYDWSGKSVTVTFPKPLKSNITYVVTIGTDLQDYNNHNRMAESYSFAFSTGDKIDKGVIAGRVFTDKPDGIMMFAYLKGDSTINPMKYKPDYISQIGKDGKFRLLGLKNGEYRVFAVKDEYHDLIYQPEQDQIGIPRENVFISGKDTLFSGLDFFVTKFDTVKPRFISAVMTDEYHVLLKFSKDIDLSMIKSNNFSLIDSTSGKSVDPNYAFKGNTKPTEMVLVSGQEFEEKDEVFVKADSIIDKYGNVFKNDYIPLTLSSKPDTTKPGIASTEPQNGSSGADYVNQSFTFNFNDAFDTTIAKSGITFSDTSGILVPYNIHFIDDASFVIMSNQNLKANTDYLIKINLAKFADLAGNKFDSLYVYRFKTINGLDFTGITGKIENVNAEKNPYLVLQNFDKEKIKYSEHVNNSEFKFDRVLPGKYKLWCYYDTDSTKTYDYGTAYPYKPAEQFWVYPDTLNLRARWIQTNIAFQIGK